MAAVFKEIKTDNRMRYIYTCATLTNQTYDNCLNSIKILKTEEEKSEVQEVACDPDQFLVEFHLHLKALYEGAVVFHYTCCSKRPFDPSNYQSNDDESFESF